MHLEESPKEQFDQDREAYRHDVEAQIFEIINQANIMGANDTEIPELRDLIDSLHKNTITPEKALARAQAILNSKQDYH